MQAVAAAAAICIPHMTSWQMENRLSREHGQTWLENTQHPTTSATHNPPLWPTLNWCSTTFRSALLHFAPPHLLCYPHYTKSHPSFSHHFLSLVSLMFSLYISCNCFLPAFVKYFPVFANYARLKTHACLHARCELLLFFFFKSVAFKWKKDWSVPKRRSHCCVPVPVLGTWWSI